MSVKLTREVEFQLPTVPNYIMHVVPPGRRQDGLSETPKTDIADLSANELDAIGAAWVKALRDKAAERRTHRREDQ